ncbi:MAG: restriction endonuclease subunit S, partial [Gammaproteobacteria bacterium]|nr:restriction endonuclease subunit S [Gammaproteobacteria bacterium]
MTDLPPNWTQTPLGCACAILDSKRIPINSKERRVRTNGKPRSDLFPYYGATGQVDVIDGYLFEGEHVLLGEDGAPFLDPFRDKAYVVDGKFWVNNHAHILKAHGSNKYLSHYLNAVRYEAHVTGTTRPKLTKRALVSIPVRLPPLNEQHRIVERIEALFDEIDRGVESLCTARRMIALYRQSLLKSAFEGRLTADWRAENADKTESSVDLLARTREEREQRHGDALDEWERVVAEWKRDGENGRRPAKPKPPTVDAATVDVPEGVGTPLNWLCLSMSTLGRVTGGLTTN